MENENKIRCPMFNRQVCPLSCENHQVAQGLNYAILSRHKLANIDQLNRILDSVSDRETNKVQQDFYVEGIELLRQYKAGHRCEIFKNR